MMIPKTAEYHKITLDVGKSKALRVFREVILQVTQKMSLIRYVVPVLIQTR